VQQVPIALPQLLEAAPTRLVGGDGVVFQPGAGGEAIEIHARINRTIHVLDGKTGNRRRRFSGTRDQTLQENTHDQALYRKQVHCCGVNRNRLTTTSEENVLRRGEDDVSSTVIGWKAPIAAQRCSRR